jgi:hypothetical protein
VNAFFQWMKVFTSVLVRIFGMGRGDNVFRPRITADEAVEEEDDD